MTVLDARGKRCPVPLAMAQARLEEVDPGATLTVLADDPEAPVDIGAWATDHGHGFGCSEVDGWVEIRLTRGTP